MSQSGQIETDARQIVDVLIIGGGINGCGIARDAAGRGLSVVLCERGDLAGATSSASTKLFHGGLRYLEYFEFRLVREALIERETLLRAMPHISWPMRFVLPYHQDMRFESDTPTSKLLSLFMPWMRGRRPAWLIRLGLFLYDNLGGRKILPGTATLALAGTREGAPLQDRFLKAYEYSDAWVEDSRLVVLNARDAEARGARINTRTEVVSASAENGIWQVTVKTEHETRTICAKMLVNAAGPWVGDVIHGKLRLNSRENVRLVRGSHIVTRKLYDHDKCYYFQGTTSSRGIVLDANMEIGSVAQEEFRQAYPQSGWVEHDPSDLWATSAATARATIEKAGLSARDIAAIGITMAAGARGCR